MRILQGCPRQLFLSPPWSTFAAGGRLQAPGSHSAARIAAADLRGWRNTVEIELLEISILMKACPSVFHAYISKLMPAIGFLLSRKISMRFPTVFRQPLRIPGLPAEPLAVSAPFGRGAAPVSHGRGATAVRPVAIPSAAEPRL